MSPLSIIIMSSPPSPMHNPIIIPPLSSLCRSPSSLSCGLAEIQTIVVLGGQSGFSGAFVRLNWSRWKGWYGYMMMLALHLMAYRHFMILIIYLATVSLLWLVSSADFPPMCTKESFMVLNDCWISCMNLSLLVVDEDRLFMELMRISKISYILSWRWTLLVAVFFDVIFLPLPFLSYS